jgi:tRNA pseudouridine55 synthase
MLSGFLNIDKPLHLTSHDVVARVRRIYRQAAGAKKVGHAGTLDPLATGVLIVCIGQATRLSDYVMHQQKRYQAQLRLGISTTTYDAEGEATAEHDATALTQADLEAVLPHFRGEIQQVPPMYSAIKQGGRKLYDLARAGQTVARPPRSVSIYALQIQAFSSPHVTLDVLCGSGTYIRSLAHDIGERLGVGAHLSGLRRISSGAFSVDAAIALDDLLQDDDWQRHVIPPREALRDYHSINLTDAQVQAVRQGQFIAHDSDTAPSSDHEIMAYTAEGHLLAILEARDLHGETVWKPRKVFPK